MSAASHLENFLNRTQELSQNGFLKQVMAKVTASLLITTACIGLSIFIGVIWINPLIQLFIMLALLFGMYGCAVTRNPQGALAFFFLFAAAEGFFLAPLIQVLFQVPGGAFIVLASAAVVTFIFAGVYGYLCWRGSEVKLSHALLTGLLFALLGLGILALCTGFQSLIFLYACAGVGIFTLYLIADLGKALFTSDEGMSKLDLDIGSTLVATNIYLDLLNLFLFMLELFVMTKSQDRSAAPISWQRLRDFLLLLIMPLVIIAAVFYYFFYYEKSDQAVPRPREGHQVLLPSSQYFRERRRLGDPAPSLQLAPPESPLQNNQRREGQGEPGHTIEEIEPGMPGSASPASLFSD